MGRAKEGSYVLWLIRQILCTNLRREIRDMEELQRKCGDFLLLVHKGWNLDA